MSAQLRTFDVDGMSYQLGTNQLWAVLYAYTSGNERFLQRKACTSLQRKVDAAVRQLLRSPAPVRVYVFHVASGRLVSRLSNERVS